MLKFKVYAGQMYCGLLTVLPGHSHNFLDRDNNIDCSFDAVAKVSGYKHLRLVRI